MMKQQALCPQGVTLTTLSSWRDQELAAADANTLAAHVAGCRFCQATMTDFAAIATTLAAQPLPTPDGRLWRGVHAGIARRGRVARGPALPRVALVGAGAFVALILVLAAVLLRLHSPATPPISVVPTVTASPTLLPGSPTVTGTPVVQAGKTAPATWAIGTLPPGFTYREFSSNKPQLTAFQMVGATAYACIGSATQQNHLAISHDRGQSWSYAAALPNGVSQCQSFVVATNDPSVLVINGDVQSGKPAYISVDSGATWQQAGDATIQSVVTYNGAIYAILTNPDPATGALAAPALATTKGNRHPLTVNHSCPCSYPTLVVSHDHLKTWQSIDGGILPAYGLTQFWLNPSNGSLFVEAFSNNAGWLSNDDGQHWTQLHVPASNNSAIFHFVVQTPTSAQDWYLCANNYCSADSGASWQPVPSGMTPIAVGADGTLYAAQSSHFYVLPPGATQWQLATSAPFPLPTNAAQDFEYRAAATGDILWIFFESEQDQPPVNPPYVTVAFH